MPNRHREINSPQSLQPRVKMIDRHQMIAIRRPVRAPTRRSLDGMTVTRAPVPVSLAETIVIKATPSASLKKLHTLHKPAKPRQERSAVLARQMVQKKPKKIVPHVTRKSRVSALLVLMAVVIFSGGSIVSYLGWKAGNAASAHADVLAESIEKIDKSSGQTPSEENISAEVLANYHVGSEFPRYLRIPRLQINSRILRQEVNISGSIGAPDNIADAGWYDGSSNPGDNGAVVITGHVAGETKSGIFYRLGNLREGDTIEIERGDGKTYRYKVVKSEAVDRDKLPMEQLLNSIEPGKPGLNLVTHSTRYDTMTNKYEQTTVVYAVQQ